jgi:hypothetical protein
MTLDEAIAEYKKTKARLESLRSVREAAESMARLADREYQEAALASTNAGHAVWDLINSNEVMP